MNLTKLIHYTGHLSSVYALADIPGSDEFISSGGDGWIVAWKKDGSTANGRLIAKVDGKVFSLYYHSINNILLAGDMNGHLYFIDLDSKQTIKRLVIHKGSIFDILCVGKDIFTCGGDGYLSKINSEKLLPEWSIQLSNQGLRCLAIYQNLLFCGASDHSIRKLDIQAVQVVAHVPNAHGQSVFSMYCNEDGILYTGGRDAILKTWDVRTCSLLQALPAHWFTINSITGISNGYLLTASRDKTIRIWLEEPLTLLFTLNSDKGGHVNSVNKAVFFKDERVVATCSDDRSIILWKISG